MSTESAAANAIEQLFLDGRSIQTFQDKPVPDSLLRRLYDLVKLAPTGFNSQPARFVFIRTQEGKDRLAPALSSSNRLKVLAAPVTAIVAYDTRFFEHLPKVFPKYDARPLFIADFTLTEETAKKNGTLQAAFLVLAARALGLDAGPMSGFKAPEVDRTFFADGRYKTNLIINLGFGVRDGLEPRGARLAFEEAVTLL